MLAAQQLLTQHLLGERILPQQRLGVPNLLLAGLLCRRAFVMRRAVDGHFTSVTASDHANQLLGYVAVHVNKPATVAVLPHAQAVYAVTPDVLGSR